MVERICAYLDLQCYGHSQDYRIREIGWISTDDDGPTHFSVHPGLLPFYNHRASQTLRYIKYHVHGLDYYPSENYIEQYMATDTVLNLYMESFSDTRDVVAYKGGWKEKQLLDELMIPSINLNEFEVPAFNFDNPDVFKYKPYCCGLHINCDEGWRFCSRSKVIYFRDYVVDHLL